MVPAQGPAEPAATPLAIPNGSGEGAAKVVVVDDDPTGCQTVANVPVVTAWGADDLRWLLTRDRSMGFVLTNSRAMAPDEARAANREVVRRCLRLVRESSGRLSVLSRSDSTLRGHFAVELRAICDELAGAGHPADLVLFAPAFFEAGRVTHDDVHWVQEPTGERPVADTAYGADPAFPFAESDLRAWVRTRLGEPDHPVSTLSLDLVRDGGSGAVAEALRRAARLHREGTFPPVVVANGVRQADYDVIAQAAREVEEEGVNLVTRCGPSYVASRLGEPVPDPLQGLPAGGRVSGPGLVVVGSHVPTSTAQLEVLVRELEPVVVELDPVMVTGPGRAACIADLAGRVADGLAGGRLTVLATSRRLHAAAGGAADNLGIAQAVSSAVQQVVQDVLALAHPAWIVAKGGITSATLVTHALGLRRGWVVGQLQRGHLPLWRDDAPMADTPPCVIFPGNVGGPGTLVDVVRTLSDAA
jgi:uncharacterized protein YgbK (DUF1537 family)